MIDKAKTARPYAEAAFAFAQEHQQVKQWQHHLQLLAEYSQDEQVQKIINNPNITPAQLIAVFTELGGNSDNAINNFIKQLGENQRLSLLPEIAELFQQLVNEAEKTIEAEVYSAIELDEPFIDKLSKALQKKFGRKVVLRSIIDPSLLGGLVVRANDTVIDNSIRSQLERMQQNLVN